MQGSWKEQDEMSLGRLTTFEKPYIKGHTSARSLVMFINAKLPAIFIISLPNLMHSFSQPVAFL